MAPPSDRSVRRRILLAGLASMGLLVLLRTLPASTEGREQLREAAHWMDRGIQAAREAREARGIRIDPSADPNGTGLIGPEISPLVTTVGSLESKRTATSPEMAVVTAWMLRRAGAEPGETVAVGASGSFPGLLTAVLSACRALDAEPAVILSLGASSWGAAHPDFHLLDLHGTLREAGLTDRPPLAVSVGGEGDEGGGLDRAVVDGLREEVLDAGIPLIEEPDLQRNATLRLHYYQEAAGGGKPAAFVNIGGAWANMGTSEVALGLRPGLNTHVRRPPPGQGGVVHAMAARRVPVIHLLHLRGLTARYGLQWDPVPLPHPEEPGVYRRLAPLPTLFRVALAAYLLCLAGLAVVPLPRGSHRSRG
ncbi:MAG: poly-gamma-glutamate system protein [bacterium]